MYMFVVALHVVLSIFLVLIVILQPGKGGDIGSAFGGGGSGSVFGPRGPTNMLQQATTAIAVMFMVTSITLARFSDRASMSGGNVTDALLEQQERKKAQDAEEATAPGTDVEASVSAGSDVAEEPVEAEEPAAEQELVAPGEDEANAE